MRLKVIVLKKTTALILCLTCFPGRPSLIDKLRDLNIDELAEQASPAVVADAARQFRDAFHGVGEKKKQIALSSAAVWSPTTPVAKSPSMVASSPATGAASPGSVAPGESPKPGTSVAAFVSAEEARQEIKKQLGVVVS